MEDLLSALLVHSAENRGVDRHKLEYSGLRAETSTHQVLQTAVRLLTKLVGSEETKLSRELAETFSYRILFLLLPEECLFGDPDRDKPLISAHLTALGVTPRDDLVRAIKFLVDNFRSKTRREQPKTTITDVYVRYPRIYSTIIDSQRGRCATCGKELLYGTNMQLDHVLPWHLGDDPSDGSNWQFLCDVCNRGKGMLPHYSLSVLHANWIKPSVLHELGEDVRYAALKRDGKCWKTGAGPKEAELVVEKRIRSGCWILDNVRTTAAL